MEKEIMIYSEAIRLARNNNQTIGEKNDYYITIDQLDFIIQQINQGLIKYN